MSLRNSALYECSVMHHRREPRTHTLRYRFFMFSLDLDELDLAARLVRGFAHNHRAPYEFRDTDHPVPGTGTLKQRICAWVARNAEPLPDDVRIQLVTLPRVLGYVFNPVSFYFCFTASGLPLQAVAEVGNTFGEHKLYLLGAPDADGRIRHSEPKHFYVSPFSALDLSFDFRLAVPGDTLHVRIDDLEGTRRVFLSALQGQRVPLTSARLAWLTLKCPLVTVKVIGLIHWHALLLWLKRVPFHRKVAGRALQRDVLRAHRSMTESSP